MTAGYIKRIIQKSLVPVLVAFLVMFVPWFITILAETEVTWEAFLNLNGEIIIDRGSTTSLELVYIGCFSVAVFAFAPAFVNMYRFSKKKADFYYSTPINKKSFRIVSFFTIFVLLIIAFTLAFWLCTIAVYSKIDLIAKSGSIPKMSDAQFLVGNYITVQAEFRLEGFLYAYLYLLINNFTVFVIMYFVVSKANNITNSILLDLFGYFILTFFIMVLSGMLTKGGKTGNVSTNLGISGINTLLYVHEFLCPFICKATNSPVATSLQSDIVFLTNHRISFILQILASSGLLFDLFFRREPSGEYAGKAVSKGPLSDIIFHGGILTICNFFTLTFSIVSFSSFLLLFTTYGISYYLFLSLFRKTFKPQKKDLWTVLPVSVSMLFTLIFTI